MSSSSIAGLPYSPSDVTARWTPSITEAGVILNPESLLEAAGLPETDDFVQIAASLDSSYMSIESPPSGKSGKEEMSNYTHQSTVDKLEQLRRFQQQLKTQLNSDWLENHCSNLQGLQEEDTLTILPSAQNGIEIARKEGSKRDGFSMPRENHNNRYEKMQSDRPIQASKQPFEKLLEDQLMLEEQRLNSAQNPDGGQSAGPSKRPFLRRGQGLSRFTSKASLLKVDSKTGPEPSSNSELPRRHPMQRITAVMNKENCSRDKRDTTKVGKKVMGTKVLGCHQSQNTGREERTDKAPPATKTMLVPAESPRDPQGIPEMSLVEKLQSWQREPHQESMELGEFELLERAAEELSFSSNSSFVNKILQMDREKRKVLSAVGLHQRRLSSTPVKSSAAVEQRHSPETNSRDKEDAPADKTEPETAVAPVFSNDLCFPVATQAPYDKRPYQDGDSEESVSSIGDSDDEGDSTLQDDKDDTADRVVFDDDNTWDDNDGDDTVVSAEATTAERGNSEPPAPARPQFPSSKLMTKLFKPKTQNEPPPTTDDSSTPANDKADENVQQIQSTKLRERLVELELEIEHFKKENAALAKLRQENQKIQDNLKKDRLAWEQQRTEQLAHFEEYKQEETKKLQRERKVFERHAVAARAVPDKKEREEIQALKQQLSSAQDDLRKKESRWSAAQNRLRQQVETLAQENKELKDEVHMLEKLRLSAMKNSANADKDIKRAPHVTKVTFANPLDSRGNPSNGSNAVPTKGNSATQVRKGMKKSNLKKTTGASPPPPPSSSPRQISEEKETATKEKSQVEEPTESNLLISSKSNEAESIETESLQEVINHPDGKVEKVLLGGDRVILFPNGTKKEVSRDGSSIKITFFNGDIKEVMADQRVLYYYLDTKTTHITYPDGMEVLHFPNNQTEKHFPDGSKEITFADQTVKTLYADGSEESVMTDGTVVQLKTDGTKEIHFITGQKEVHTAEYKRREYPDGTVKTVYADGRQETRYPDGRLRVKDEQGNVLMDKRP
ncbi:centrosomal P4.1-associated protein isoform X2 [Stigmatopora nigra]